MPLLPREEARALLYVQRATSAIPKYVSITHHYTSEFLDMIINPSYLLSEGYIRPSADNSSASTSITPKLTTVDQHMDQCGWTMADVVIKAINGVSSPRVMHLNTDLVVRDSA